MSNRLEIKDLWVEVDKNPILKGINMTVPEGQTHILFGPNGCGKTTLLLAIMGYPGYHISKGSIIYKEEDITNSPIDYRAKAGIGISFQKPPSIKGVTLKKLLNSINHLNNNEEGFVDILKMKEYLDRDINIGFSGGETKRSELLQLLYQNPDLVLFDEPESGVDIENLKIIGNVIRDLLYKKDACLIKKCIKSALMITHTGFILDYVNADMAYVMVDGRILCKGNPGRVFSKIQESGFKECEACQ